MQLVILLSDRLDAAGPQKLEELRRGMAWGEEGQVCISSHAALGRINTSMEAAVLLSLWLVFTTLHPHCFAWPGAGSSPQLLTCHGSWDNPEICCPIL